MAHLQQMGVRFAVVTLHVGLDTFAPVTEEDPVEHKIHTEWCELTPETAEMVNLTRQQGGQDCGGGNDQCTHPGIGGAPGRTGPGGGAVLWSDRFIYPARVFLQGGRWNGDQLPPAAFNPANAGQRFCRSRTCSRGLSNGGQYELPFLFLWRCHVNLLK